MKSVPLIVLLIFAFAACQPNKSNHQESTESSNTALDTMVFKTSSDQSIYVGTRILPEPHMSDSAAVDFLTNSEISSVVEVGDTIFVFLNNNMLINGENEHFPQVNDSLLEYYYPKMYDVEIDDDLPYIAYLRSDKDYVQLTKSKRTGEFYWEGAAIKDTVLTFMNGIKIGATKDSVLENFNLTNNNKTELTIILCHASIPSKVWYKPYLPKLRNYQYRTIPVLLTIEKNVLTGILIDPWICHGGVNEQLLTKLE